MQYRDGKRELSFKPAVLIVAIKTATWAVVTILALFLWFVLTVLGYAPKLPITLGFP